VLCMLCLIEHPVHICLVSRSLYVKCLRHNYQKLTTATALEEYRMIPIKQAKKLERYTQNNDVNYVLHGR